MIFLVLFSSLVVGEVSDLSNEELAERFQNIQNSFSTEEQARYQSITLRADELHGESTLESYKYLMDEFNNPEYTEILQEMLSRNKVIIVEPGDVKPDVSELLGTFGKNPSESNQEFKKSLQEIKEKALQKRKQAIDEIIGQINDGIREIVTTENEELKAELIQEVNRLILIIEKESEDTDLGKEPYKVNEIIDLKEQMNKIKDAKPGEKIEIKQDDTGKTVVEVTPPPKKTNWMWFIIGIVLVSALVGGYKAKRKWWDKKGQPGNLDSKIREDLIYEARKILKGVRDRLQLAGGYGYSGYALSEEDKRAQIARFDEIFKTILKDDEVRKFGIRRGWMDKLFWRRKRKKAIANFVEQLSGAHVTEEEKERLAEMLFTATVYLSNAKSLMTTFSKSGLGFRRKRYEKQKQEFNTSNEENE